MACSSLIDCPRAECWAENSWSTEAERNKFIVSAETQDRSKVCA